MKIGDEIKIIACHPELISFTGCISRNGHDILPVTLMSNRDYIQRELISKDNPILNLTFDGVFSGLIIVSFQNHKRSPVYHAIFHESELISLEPMEVKQRDFDSKQIEFLHQWLS